MSSTTLTPTPPSSSPIPSTPTPSSELSPSSTFSSTPTPATTPLLSTSSSTATPTTTPTPRIPVKVSAISGPISLTEYYSDTLGKHVYIFGETHQLGPTSCPRFKSERDDGVVVPVETFLLKLLQDAQKSGTTIDVFLEIEYLSRNRLPDINAYGVGPAHRVARSLIEYGCLQLDKSKCLLSPARIHYTDTRDWEGMHRWNPGMSQYWKVPHREGLIDLIHDGLKGLITKDNILGWKSLYKHYEQFFADSSSLAFFLSQGSNAPKIVKQVAEVKDAHVQRVLETTHSQCLVDTERALPTPIGWDHLWEALLQAGGASGELTTARAKEYLKALRLSTVLISACNMDLYLLARMFRSFKAPAPPVSKVIIVAGDWHAEQYRQFLERVGFVRVAETRDPDMCLDIRAFQQPFFSDPLLAYPGIALQSRVQKKNQAFWRTTPPCKYLIPLKDFKEEYSRKKSQRFADAFRWNDSKKDYVPIYNLSSSTEYHDASKEIPITDLCAYDPGDLE